MGDLFHPPGARAEQEYLPNPRLQHHLLVQLPYSSLPLLCPEQEDSVKAAVRNGAGFGNSHPFGALARVESAVQSIPGDPGSQLREII